MQRKRINQLFTGVSIAAMLTERWTYILQHANKKDEKRKKQKQNQNTYSTIFT